LAQYHRGVSRRPRARTKPRKQPHAQ
jgi:hypothetical protein